jgi:hypothetical protein
MQIEEAHLSHIENILPNLRSVDVQNALAFGIEIGDSIRSCLSASTYKRTWKIGPDVVCMWGVARVKGRTFAWLFCSNLVMKHKRAFLKLHREIAAEVAMTYPDAEAFVDQRYRGYVHWLRGLGVEVSRPVSIAKASTQFVHVKVRA